jgi:hypothetical protein
MLNAVTNVMVLGEVPGIGEVTGTGDVLGLDEIAVTRVLPPAGEAPLAARVCAEITRLAPTAPLVMVAVGDLAALLPAVALAQRAARRQVLAYVLIDPHYPPVSEGWPDARVYVLGSLGVDLRTAELRGWETAPVTDLRDLILEILAHQ